MNFEVADLRTGLPAQGHLRRSVRVLIAFTLAASLTASAAEPQPSPAPVGRPNVLWITAEDISPDLGCYGDAYAATPNIDRLAREGVRYTHAFATAPVCSPARSCLITGLYATSLGTQHLRSLFPIPDEFQGYPAYLRKAGYYCTNNEKTDYNTANERAIIAASWDESSGRAHWRKRPAGQPFFSVFNLMVSHQSRASVWSFEQFEAMISKVLTPAERHDPDRAPVPPYYPDTPTVRRTLARYYDCVTAMDKEVGRILDELAADGLAEDTVVFFYGDNGRGLPRGKRTLYDTGLHEPFIIRFPQKYQHLAPAAPGQTTDRLVSFVDFAATVLSLTGLQPPPYMQGVAFLGPHAGPPREVVYGARDRVDEAYDLSPFRARSPLPVHSQLCAAPVVEPAGGLFRQRPDAAGNHAVGSRREAGRGATRLRGPLQALGGVVRHGRRSTSSP